MAGAEPDQAVDRLPEPDRGVQVGLADRPPRAQAGPRPQPYIDCWADDPEVTLFGAWGPIELGHPAVTSTFRWVGSRSPGHSGGGVENTVVYASGDLAYTVGYEHSTASVNGGPAEPKTLRVTHVYRRENAEWKIVHRHGDNPPPEQRPPTEA